MAFADLYEPIAQLHHADLPGWDPSREGRPATGSRPGRKEGQRPATCSECGGPLRDPIRSYGAHVRGGGGSPSGLDAGGRHKRAGSANRIGPLETVCAGCNSSSIDGSRQLDRAVKGGLVQDAATDRVDERGRTTDAVQGPEIDRPLTRREKRALKFGPNPGGQRSPR